MEEIKFKVGDIVKIKGGYLNGRTAKVEEVRTEWNNEVFKTIIKYYLGVYGLGRLDYSFDESDIELIENEPKNDTTEAETKTQEETIEELKNLTTKQKFERLSETISEVTSGIIKTIKLVKEICEMYIEHKKEEANQVNLSKQEQEQYEELMAQYIEKEEQANEKE